MGKSVHVVLLAGGYVPEIESGVAAAVEAAGTPGKLTGALAAAAAMGRTVVPGLLPLDGTPALVRVLKGLQGVRRASLAAVWIVHNESDADRIRGSRGLFGSSPASDLGLPTVNFLSNGATEPGNWRGETADFRSALTAISKSGSNDVCVAGISCALAFMPNYNLQRLLEHSYLRGRDVLGLSFLNGVDLTLLGSQGHTEVVPGEETALPRIRTLRPLLNPTPGSMAVQPAYGRGSRLCRQVLCLLLDGSH
ncbi:hypothetical protein Vretimale_7148 [Volvox reticuliferus]|uniref:Uncharacterized protein n=1 Tax=Volvox reticuliferus TaxID=1737510 RepID=A0A8J4FPN5_9CHLO|nr:hypothetical protein Vretifemale_11130 [Volvox reticuliferus]GIM02303.1 hypothetical protein Vretimale_7148 [Volvox reticuliferus]